jgi:hypothetical protein
MPAKKLYIENCFRDKNLGINTAANIIVYEIKQSLGETTITFLCRNFVLAYTNRHLILRIGINIAGPSCTYISDDHISTGLP